jgi:hypothetical protein
MEGGDMKPNNGSKLTGPGAGKTGPILELTESLGLSAEELPMSPLSPDEKEVMKVMDEYHRDSHPVVEQVGALVVVMLVGLLSYLFFM